MTYIPDIEPMLDSWLAEGTDVLPDRSVEAVLRTVDRTTQRRAWRVPWRTLPMNTPSGLGKFAAALVVVLAIGGIIYLTGSRPAAVGGPVASPTRSPAPTLSPTSTATPTQLALDDGTWLPYQSEQYRFSLGYPADWTIVPSKRAWDPAVDARDALSPAHESFRAPDGSIRVSAWVVPADPSTVQTAADFGVWVETFCSTTDIVPCVGIAERAVPLCREKRDCHPSGFLVPFEDETVAFLTGNDFGPGESWLPRGMQVVALWRPESDPAVVPYGGARRLLEEFLATMDVWPEASPFRDRVSPLAMPSP